jgi:hypothetical protein
LQGLQQSEVSVGVLALCKWFELDQEIHIALLRVKLVAGGRAK